ncbi:MAG: hypothetical protein Q9162_003288 [Coniocarpon cinnabarinum]
MSPLSNSSAYHNDLTSDDATDNFLASLSDADPDDLIKQIRRVQISRHCQSHREKPSKVTKSSSKGKAKAKALGSTGMRNGKHAPKPLNSFVAFRAYYLSLPFFKDMHQREVSGFMQKLWQNDLFEAKWSIIAKAWTDLRDDEGFPIMKVRDFCDFACPKMGILKPEDYLAALGWTLIESVEGKKLEKIFEPELSNFQEDIRVSNVSSVELVQESRAAFGNTSGGSQIPPPTSTSQTGPTMTMVSTSTAPAPNVTNSSHATPPDTAESSSLPLSTNIPTPVPEPLNMDAGRLAIDDLSFHFWSSGSQDPVADAFDIGGEELLFDAAMGDEQVAFEISDFHWEQFATL